VDVHIEADASTRDVTVPIDLAEALNRDQQARDFYDTLAYTHRKEWVRWIEDAKKPETRATRLMLTLDALRSGKRTR
jgi:uncharacterized protein YdeI (YjbR/CyaY-like superfamily)